MTRGEALSKVVEVAVERLNQCRHELGLYDVADDLPALKEALETLGCFVNVDANKVLRVTSFGEEFE